MGRSGDHTRTVSLPYGSGRPMPVASGRRFSTCGIPPDAPLRCQEAQSRKRWGSPPVSPLGAARAHRQVAAGLQPAVYRRSGLPTPSRRTLTAVILTSVRSEVSALSPSRLRWPPTPSRGHGQPLAEFSSQPRMSEPRVPMSPWLRRRGLRSCFDGGLEFLEARQAEELLERAEEHLDDPPQPIDLRDEFSRRLPARSRSVPTFRSRDSSGRIFRRHFSPCPS